MSQIYLNIRESYQDFFEEIKETQEFAKKTTEVPLSEEEILEYNFRIGSIALKVFGTLNLICFGLITFRTLKSRSLSIKKCFFGGVFLINGHDLLKAGSNMYDQFVKDSYSYNKVLVNGLSIKKKEEWEKLQKVKKRKGKFAAFKASFSSAKDLSSSGIKAMYGDEKEEARLYRKGISSMMLDGTYLLKPIVDWILCRDQPPKEEE